MSRGACIAIEQLSVELSGRRVLGSISTTLPAGRITGVIGPNGAGKSTLLRCLYRGHRPSTGCISIDGADITRHPLRRHAALVAAQTQEMSTDFDFTVAEMLSMGRRAGPIRTPADDTDIIASAAELCGVAELLHVPFSLLSGGERQRTLIGRALAQDTPVLILDEPANHLDLRYRIELMSAIRTVERTVVMAIHDLDLALQVCDRVIALDAGRQIADGPAAEVLTPALVERLYGVTPMPVRHPRTGSEHLIFALDGIHQRSPQTHSPDPRR